MKKTLLNNLIFLITFGCLTSCDVSTQQTVKTANLNIWVNENEKAIVEEVIKDWNANHVKNQQFNVSFTIHDETECVEMFNEMYDDNNAPSMMLIDDKDIPTLALSGMLEEVKGDKKEQLITDNTEFSIKGSTFDDKLYSYPISSDSGYFLWYNSEYLLEDSISSLEDILKYAKDNDKKVYFNFDDGYYISSLFSSPDACGLDSMKYEIIKEKSEDKKEILTQVVYDTNWIEQDSKGLTFLNYAFNLLYPYYSSNTLLTDDTNLIEGFNNGSIIAAIYDSSLELALKDSMKNTLKADKLPSYHINNEAYQMASYTGNKAYVINKYASVEEQVTAASLASLLISKETQLKRYEKYMAIPTNKSALRDELFVNNKSMSVTALEKQRNYSVQASLYVENRYYETISYIVQKMYVDLLDSSELRQLFIDEINKLKEPKVIQENKKNFFN